MSKRLKDIATKGGEDINDSDINVSAGVNLNKQMMDIIQNYKNSFAPMQNSFTSSNDNNILTVNKCSESML